LPLLSTTPETPPTPMPSSAPATTYVSGLSTGAD
jgi:hypothetical protein